jgi:hypothetical protein
MAGGTGPHSFPYEAQVTASRRTTLCRRLSRVRAPETFSIGPTGEPASGYVVRVPEEEAVGDLVEDEGVNAGSRDAERDRDLSGRPPVRPTSDDDGTTEPVDPMAPGRSLDDDTDDDVEPNEPA